MYKLLLCWRYLKTRYLALACIISVMLGVATLIVVNSVMNGFSTKLRDRLHALLSDVVIEAVSLQGFHDPEGKMERIRQDPFLGPRIAGMAPTMEVFAMLQYEHPRGQVSRPVKLVGIDPATRSCIGDFANHLVAQKGTAIPSFEISPEARKRFEFREEMARQRQLRDIDDPLDPDVPPPPAPTPQMVKIPTGAIVGNLIASFRMKNKETNELEEHYLLNPGDRIILTTVGGEKLAPVFDEFILVDYFKSEMSEYDSQYIFVDLAYLQHLRTMPNRVSSLQIKLKNFAEADQVVEALKELFKNDFVHIETWEVKQGPLLEAIRIEKGILNVLLFLIIAVAGFGILAIFSMIVAEKTRDIGVLKALGATNGGVMKIFLGYGLLLGMVGAGLGSGLGLLITHYINNIEQWLSSWTGKKVFDPVIYYFDSIPTDVDPNMVVMVNLGALSIAVLFSVLPALRAAWLHPVRALRYE